MDLETLSKRGLAGALALLAVAISNPISVSAQELSTSNDGSSDDESEELILLDPFSISATDAVGYSAATSASLSRMNIPVIDVPQTVNIVTTELLQDTGAFSTRDAFNYVSNVEPRTNNHQSGIFMIRGLQTDLTYVDGYAAPAVERDMAPYARVEVIKGPASSLVGRGEPSGVINYVRKKPSNRRSVETSLAVGTQNFFRGDVDATGPLGEGDDLTYRLIGFYESGDGHRDFTEIERMGLYPSLEWKVTEKTRILFQGEYLNSQWPNDIGYAFMWNKWLNNWRVARFNPDPPYPSIEREFSLDGPGSERNYELFGLNVSLRHDFADWAHLMLGVNGVNNTLDAPRFQGLPSVTYDAATDTQWLNRRYQADFNEEDDYRAQGSLVFNYDFIEALRATHVSLVGFEYVDRSESNRRDTGSIAPVNLTNVVQNGRSAAIYDQTISNLASNHTQEDAQATGFYFSQNSHFWDDLVTLTFGVRYDRAEGTRTNNAGEVTELEPDDTTAPRWGIGVKPWDWLHVYYVHSEQEDPEFQTQLYSGLPANDPRNDMFLTGQRRGILDEVGFKGEALNGKLGFTVARYKLTREDTVFQVPIAEVDPDFDFSTVPDTGDPFAYTQSVLATGETLEGWEFEVYGQPIEELTFVANFATTDGTAPVGGLDDIKEIAVPEWQGSTFGKYSFRSADGNGFTVRAGLRVYGPHYLTILNVEGTKLDRVQSAVDAGISYHWGRHTFDFAVYNAFDDVVIYHPNSELDPQNFQLTWRTRW